MKKEKFADEMIRSATDKGSRRKISIINSIIIHTTGYGPGLKRINERNVGSLRAIGKTYAVRMANVLRYKGHFLIDHTGKIWQFIPITEVAWHTGSAKRKILGKSEPPMWWRERWPDLENPLDLPPWRGGGPNGNSIGIDLLAHGNGAISEGYTELQYQSLAKLIKDLTASTSVPISREHILGHEDVDPISRGTDKGGWDPGKFDWDKLFDVIKPVHKIPEIPIKKPLKVWSLIRRVLFGR